MRQHFKTTAVGRWEKFVSIFGRKGYVYSQPGFNGLQIHGLKGADSISAPAGDSLLQKQRALKARNINNRGR